MSKKMAWGEEQDQAAAGFQFQGEQDLGAEFQFQEDQDALRSILENKGIGRAQVRYLLKVFLALFHFWDPDQWDPLNRIRIMHHFFTRSISFENIIQFS
jgi:hypothetical protein